MTAADFIHNIRLMGDAPHPQTFFLYIAAHADFIRLGNGEPLSNAKDFNLFLAELSEAAALNPPRNGHVLPMKSRDCCHGCGHPHRTGEECLMLMGGAGPCGCRVGVSA